MFGVKEAVLVCVLLPSCVVTLVGDVALASPGFKLSEVQPRLVILWNTLTFKALLLYYSHQSDNLVGRLIKWKKKVKSMLPVTRDGWDTCPHCTSSSFWLGGDCWSGLWLCQKHTLIRNVAKVHTPECFPQSLPLEPQTEIKGFYVKWKQRDTFSKLQIKILKVGYVINLIPLFCDGLRRPNKTGGSAKIPSSGGRNLFNGQLCTIKIWLLSKSIKKKRNCWKKVIWSSGCSFLKAQKTQQTKEKEQVWLM